MFRRLRHNAWAIATGRWEELRGRWARRFILGKDPKDSGPFAGDRYDNIIESNLRRFRDDGR